MKNNRDSILLTLLFIRSKGANYITKRTFTIRHKILSALFVLLTVVPQIYTPAYAGKAQDKALFSAAQKGDIEKAKHLLATGAKVDAIDRFGDQPIHDAVQGGNTELVKTLLMAGAKVDAVSGVGFQPIHYAAQKGNIELVQVLLAAGAKVDSKVAASNKFGGQPIHFAAQSGNAELVKILLAAGARAEAKDNSGMPPFHWITTKGDPELVKKVLLTVGAKKVPTVIDEMKPIWRVIAEPQIRLGLWDKISVKQNYTAKYTVRCEIGAVFAAEKSASAGDSESSMVFFPKDFHYALKGMESHQASGCSEGKYGTKFTWAVYADDVLIYSGTMIFTAKPAH